VFRESKACELMILVVVPAESPWAANIYQHARASGKDHPHAIRILARAWIRVIWRCWLNGVTYDPAQHGAARAIQHRHSRRAVDTGSVMRGSTSSFAATARRRLTGG
jgi:hypothetical protein